jgi:hypothetical protein
MPGASVTLTAQLVKAALHDSPLQATQVAESNDLRPTLHSACKLGRVMSPHLQLHVARNPGKPVAATGIR